MNVVVIVIVAVGAVVLLGLLLAVRIVQQYEMGVHFRLGKVIGARGPGLRLIVPVIDVLRRVSLRIVHDAHPVAGKSSPATMSASTSSAVAYFKVVDAVKSVIAIENIFEAINQIAQTTLRKVVGQHTPRRSVGGDRQDQLNIREILDVATAEWGLLVTLVELKDIQLPDSIEAGDGSSGGGRA